MDTRMDSLVGVGPWGDAPRTLCVHFAADGREHSMWYLDADDAAPTLTGFTAGLTTDWHRSPAGVHRASVLRKGGDVLCEAMLLESSDVDASSIGASTAGATSTGTSWPGSRRRDNALLRAEGIPSYPASMLSGIRHRPLLVTFARRVDLPQPLARHVHGLLLRTLPGAFQCAACLGSGHVHGEPCLACS